MTCSFTDPRLDLPVSACLGTDSLHHSPPNWAQPAQGRSLQDSHHFAADVGSSTELFHRWQCLQVRLAYINISHIGGMNAEWAWELIFKPRECICMESKCVVIYHLALQFFFVVTFLQHTLKIANTSRQWKLNQTWLGFEPRSFEYWLNAFLSVTCIPLQIYLCRHNNTHCTCHNNNMENSADFAGILIQFFFVSSNSCLQWVEGLTLSASWRARGSPLCLASFR